MLVVLKNEPIEAKFYVDLRVLHVILNTFSVFGDDFGCKEHLKVPKCENFHRTDFFYFFTIKPLWVCDFRAKIKNKKF